MSQCRKDTAWNRSTRFHDACCILFCCAGSLRNGQDISVLTTKRTNCFKWCRPSTHRPVWLQVLIKLVARAEVILRQWL